MAKTIFHASIEGAQHGAKSLEEFVVFAKNAGAAGAEPSNYHVEDGNGGFKSAQEIRDTFDKHGMKLDGISCHCPMWVHTTAWTGSKTVRPFLPKEVWSQSPESVEAWCEDYILRFFDLSAELGLKIIPMFWGMSHGFEVATGYPFGFFSGPEYDLIAEGNERFVTKTAKIREAANSHGIYLCHEIHPNSAALCADDFNMLVDACDGDKCLGVTASANFIRALQVLLLTTVFAAIALFGGSLLLLYISDRFWATPNVVRLLILLSTLGVFLAFLIRL